MGAWGVSKSHRRHAAVGAWSQEPPVPVFGPALRRRQAALASKGLRRRERDVGATAEGSPKFWPVTSLHSRKDARNSTTRALTYQRGHGQFRLPLACSAALRIHFCGTYASEPPLFSRFERLVDPYPEAAPETPPRGFFAFLWCVLEGTAQISAGHDAADGGDRRLRSPALLVPGQHRRLARKGAARGALDPARARGSCCSGRCSPAASCWSRCNR